MLKHLYKFNFLSIRQINKTALAFTLFALLITISCGKRKPPLPPNEKVVQRVEISGFQRGGQILLSWKMPARNAADKSILNIRRIDIYRLLEPVSSPRTLSEQEFAAQSTLIGSLPVSNDDFALQRISYTDTLEFAAQSARLRYAIRFVNSSGQKAPFSNFLLIEPASNVAANPSQLNGEFSEKGINLFWKAPQTSINGTTGLKISGYNLYRSNSEKETARLLNEIPITETEFTDQNFEFNKQYLYFVRAVTTGNNGEPVESSESNIIKIFPVDKFPPSAPGAVTIAAAPNNLSIFFAANPENDIAGYRVFRATDPNKTKADWTLLTDELLTTNTFQDRNVESGKTYFYYLIAVDTAGNKSEPSIVVSEKAP